MLSAAYLNPLSTKPASPLSRDQRQPPEPHTAWRSCSITGMVSAVGSTTIVSIGYERRELADLIRLLTENDVDVLVDVRLNPISRKRGLSKKALSEALGDAGIGYHHERDLGNPKDNRDPFRQGLESARRRYEHHLENGASAAYERLLDLACVSRVALLCYERDHHQCHRSCITDAAQADRPAISVLRI